jgi:hypothetical protein
VETGTALAKTTGSNFEEEGAINLEKEANSQKRSKKSRGFFGAYPTQYKS